MSLLLKDVSRLITCRAKDSLPKKGKQLSDIGQEKNTNVFLRNSIIEFIGSSKELSAFLRQNNISDPEEINCKNKTVLPGFVDSHTHFIFAGERENEYEMRIKGATYQEIAAKGGGILSTVKAVRRASKGTLRKLGEKRLKNFVRYGTTTLEAKSGYGLDFSNELKTLQVINELAKKNKYSLNIIPTFLGAHAVPPEISKEEYIQLVLYKMIPEIGRNQLAVFIDVFCEKGYFNKKETGEILNSGRKFGLLPKLHTDQFNSIGGISAAIKNSAISVDHLEVTSPEDIKALAEYNSGRTNYMMATILPGVSYFLDIPYSPAREFIQNKVPVALATDFNPGSCMTENLQFIMTLASTKLKMSAEEIINAVTYNGACAIYKQDKVGSIETGKQADVLIFDMKDHKELVYHFGVNMINYVIKKGKVIYKS
jgi:imidazolonepropionase